MSVDVSIYLTEVEVKTPYRHVGGTDNDCAGEEQWLDECEVILTNGHAECRAKQ